MNDGKIHGSPVRKHRLRPIGKIKGIFGRIRGIRDQFSGKSRSGRSLHQKVENKLSRSFHQRISPLFQEFKISGIAIVFPGMLGQPGCPHGPDTLRTIGRCRETPGISKMVHHPSVGSVNGFGCAASRLYQRFHKIEKGKVQLRKLGNFGRPIVHLEIDVGVEIGIPGRFHLPGPDSLQVCRQGSGTRTPYEQITAILKKQLNQSCVGGPLFAGKGQKLVGGKLFRQGRNRTRTQMNIYTVKEFAVFGNMTRRQFTQGFGNRFRNDRFANPSRVGHLRSRVFEQPFESGIGGGSRHIECHLVGSFNLHNTLIGNHTAPFYPRRNLCCKTNTAGFAFGVLDGELAIKYQRRKLSVNRLALGILLPFHGERKVNRSFPGCGKMEHQYLIDSRNVGFSAKSDSTRSVLGGSYSCFQIETSHIIRRFLFGRVEPNFAQRLIGLNPCGLAHHMFCSQRNGFIAFPFKEEPPYFG